MIPTRFTVPIKNTVQKSEDVTVLILSSIPSIRMRTMPCISLMPVDKHHTVLDVQLESINTVFPMSSVVMTVGHNGRDVIRKRPQSIRIVENQNYDSYSQAEELRIGVNNVTTDKVLIFNGSFIFNAMSLMQLKRKHSCTLIKKDNVNNDDELGVVTNGSYVENISYGLQNTWFPIVYLEGKEFTLLKNFVNRPTNFKLCMFECINSIISRKGIIYSVEHNTGYAKNITNAKDIK